MPFIILIAKILSFLGGLLGRGSSMPGAVALKLCPGILGKLKINACVIAVSGSNGKTSTTEMIRKLAVSQGKRVICNSEGSNQTEGVVTALLKESDLFGRINADYIILESDERFCQYTFRNFTPDWFVILNLYRDQLTRNGHPEYVKGELAKGIPSGSSLVINCDEPISASLAQNRAGDVLGFGVSPEVFCENGISHVYDDGAKCPVCHGEMDYEYRIISHLGSYKCSSCGYSRRIPVHTVSDRLEKGYLIDGRYPVVPQLDNPMFAYNIAAAFTVAVNVMKIIPEEAAKQLSDYHLENTFQARIEDFELAGNPGTFILCKHENSIAYDGAIHTVCSSDDPQKTVLIAVDKLSRKYSANDMSWLWDIDFERLDRDDVAGIYLCGRFADNLAMRLLFAGISSEKITSIPDFGKCVEKLAEKGKGHIFAMTCFTDAPALMQHLKEETQ